MLRPITEYEGEWWGPDEASAVIPASLQGRCGVSTCFRLFHCAFYVLRFLPVGGRIAVLSRERRRLSS
jgi:hypothetical protein